MPWTSLFPQEHEAENETIRHFNHTCPAGTHPDGRGGFEAQVEAEVMQLHVKYQQALREKCAAEDQARKAKLLFQEAQRLQEQDMPPPTWVQPFRNLQHGELHFVDGDELQTIVDTFQKSLQRPGFQIHSAMRIQNGHLWDMFAAKRRALRHRGRSEGLTDAHVDSYEKKW